MIKKLRRKFILVNMVIVTVMLLVIFGLILGSTGRRLREKSDRSMEFLLEAGRFPVFQPGQQGDQSPIPYFLVTISRDGRILALQGDNYDLSDQSVLKEIIRQALEDGGPRGYLPRADLRFSREDGPWAIELVFLDVSGHRASLLALAKTLGWVGILASAAFLGISILLARWAVGPVEKAWNTQKQFIADASHELKTPLTVIMTNAELLTEPGCNRERSVGSILIMTRQMRSLVERLLDLARLDNGTARQEYTVIDLSALTEDALLPFEPVYFERGLGLESSIEAAVQVQGDLRQLQQVLDILLDNGAKYSAPGGTAVLTLRRQGSHALLSFATPGAPMDKADLINIFRRFYRMDKARSSGSYGLGLAIAQSILQEHRGRIWAESAEGINTFFVQLNALG